jgi:predicted anti-sigma-YlaC factor YlaD
MKCEKLHKDLIFYAEGSLTSERKNEINYHLSECNTCRKFVLDLAYSLEIIDKEKRIETNPFLYSKVINKINNYEHSAKTFRVFAVRILRPVFVILLILFGIFSGIRLGNSYSSRYTDEDSELQIITYYLNDLQHESVETILLSEELEIENIN